MTNEDKKQDAITIKRHVSTAVEKYIKRNAIKESEIVVNSWLLNASIDSALIDMARMCEFHLPNQSRPDRHKFAGFISKWVAKFKPLQFIDNIDGSQIDSRKMWSNAELAIYIFQSFINKPIPNEVIQNLKYSFMYRDERGETLALLAYCTEEMISHDWG